MSNSKISQPKLAIVIHTEEEFDWNGGFYRSNNQVTHGEKLITFCEALISIGAKITFALDYAFVNSSEGQVVIKHLNDNHSENVEFASHLHPWVNPPFAEQDKISNYHSYPGNLEKEFEFDKLKLLTIKIEEVCGIQPTTYLAGRYGIGKNTRESLKTLGYKIDISISPFSDFCHQQGPDFSHFNNKTFEKNGIQHWPHTTAIVSLFPFVEKWFDRNPEYFEKLQKNSISKLLLKLLRVKRHRLSPEGFSLQDLKNITKTQLLLGHENLIFSFHSPSVQAGLTPYVKNKHEEKKFLQTSLDYIDWFQQNRGGTSCLIKEQYTEQMNNA